MIKFWAFVSTENQGYIRVEILAESQYKATQILKAQYGIKLMTEAAYA